MCTSVPSEGRIHLCAHAPMYTSGSIANSQRMLTEINKIDAIGKIRIWVESEYCHEWKVILSMSGKGYCPTLKAFTIISSEWKFHFLS